jgi:hypothetical protein
MSTLQSTFPSYASGGVMCRNPNYRTRTALCAPVTAAASIERLFEHLMIGHFCAGNGASTAKPQGRQVILVFFAGVDRA